MKRPLSVAGFSFGVGVFTVSLFDYKIALILCLLSTALFIACLFIKRFHKTAALAALIFFSFGLFAGGLCSLNIQSTAESLDGVTVSGAEFTVKEKISRAQAVGTLKISETSYVTAAAVGNGFEPYKVYRVSGSIEEITGQYKRFYLSSGATVQIICDGLEPEGKTGGDPIMMAASALRDKCSEKIYGFLPQKQADLIDALLLGNKSSLSHKLQESFRLSGVSHIAVVSGAHLSVIITFVYGLLYFLTRRRRLSSAVSIAAVLLFMLITGLSLSVLRAGIMCIIMLMGGLFSRRSNSLNSLGGAVLLITAVNPAAVYDTGFLLSVSATLGIITLSPYMMKKSGAYLTGGLGKAINFLIAKPFFITISAAVATAPILIISFGGVSVYFILTNIIIHYTASLLLITSLLFLLSSFVPFLIFLTYPLALVSGIFADIISLTVTTAASLPGARLDISMPYAAELVIFLAAAAAVVGIIKRTAGSVIKASFGAVIIFSLIFAIFTALNIDNTYLTLLSTGNGITAVLSRDGERAVISCGGSGGKYDLQSFLEDGDFKNILAVKGGTRECGALFNTVYENLPAENVFIQETDRNKSIAKSFGESDITLYNSEQSIDLWGSVTVRLIPIEKTTATVIELKDGCILLLPNPEYAPNIPDAYKSPSILVTTAPVSDNSIAADRVIIAANDKNDREYADDGVYGGTTVSLLQSAPITVALRDKILYVL